MADDININPKSQRQKRVDTIEPYKVERYEAKKPGSTDRKKREQQRSVKNDNVKPFTLGLRDIDEAIFYYFNNVIKPSVIQKGYTKAVPVLYGSPERWKTVQSDGFYRDEKGKIQLPLILIKRNTISKNRNLGNKMDANNPHNFGVFKKKWSKKNQYDRFSILNNRTPVDEYYAVAVPDYLNITYSCMIFTQFIEQMNKIIEGINYASDSYWGNPERFSFRAMINDFNMVTELVKGQDRTVKTEFDINLMGHIVPDTINTLRQGNLKYFSKGAVIFGLESVVNINDL